MDLDLSVMSNEELSKQFLNEILYYTDDLDALCKIIRKQMPRKMMYRIISKLYRIRTTQQSIK